MSTKISDNNIKWQQLLHELKTTTEGLLNSQATFLWNIYGGLNRLHTDLEKIFRHGCKGTVTTDDSQTTDFWPFIEGLRWLQPENVNSSFSIHLESPSNLPSYLKQKCSIWLYNSLENHSLSQKLSWLLSDRKHVLECYQADAFLCQQEYTEALLICLKAVELNQASLISEIKPNLLFHTTCRTHKKLHRRCVSFQDSHLKLLKNYNHPVATKIESTQSILETKGTKFVRPVMRTWNSMPELHSHDVKPRDRSNTISKMSASQPQSPEKSPQVASKSKPKRAENIAKHVVIDFDIVEHTPPKESTYLSKSPIRSMGTPVPEYSFLSYFNGICAKKDVEKLPKKTFIEDGGLSVLPMATGYFPKPAKGQSLTAFLISSQQARGNAELDRENAHFGICEAVISAMEQIKSKKEQELEDSDEEINILKQKIRLRRKQRFEEREKMFYHSPSDTKTDTTTASPTSMSSSTGSSSSNLFSDEDLFEVPRGAPDGASDVLSAESVALSLISKFSEKQLPRASELEWLVSEEDAPQALLPLPKSWPVNPDEVEQVTPLRGTKDWAPPRPQIIFTLLPFTSRKDIIQKQNYKCAGCGTKVAEKYASKLRYCHYLGRYFCTGCHTNQLAVIPARIIHKWNFSRYSVSTFSYRLIEQMYTDPLFRVFQLNKSIGKLSKNLLVCKKYREGLHFLKDYILSCRFADTIQDYFNSEKGYIFNDPDIYSLEDLERVRTGEMKAKLKQIVEAACRHTIECQLCQARGFICEICNSPEIIYPWQSKIVNRCSDCGTCFHRDCWNKDKTPCPRCNRLLSRSCERLEAGSSSSL